MSAHPRQAAGRRRRPDRHVSWALFAGPTGMNETLQIGVDLQHRPKGRLFRRVGRLVVLLVLLNLAWRSVRYGLAFPIWGDEGFVTRSLFSADFADLLGPIEYDQIAPPGFLWVELAIVRLLGTSEYAFRLAPYLCGLASMLLLWNLARNTLDRRTALLAIGIFAASYYPVRHSVEVKPYAGDLLVSLVLTNLGWAVFRHPRSAARWALLTCAAALGVWLSFPAVFVAAGVGVYLAGRGIRSPGTTPRLGYVAYCLVVGASFLAVYYLAIQPQSQEASWLHRSWRSTFPPLARPWRMGWWLVRMHTGNMLAYPVGAKNAGSTGTLLLVVLGCAVVWRRRRGMLVLLLGPLAFTFLGAAMKRYPYGTTARTMLYMAPAFCLLAGIGLSRTLTACLRRRHVPGGFLVVALVLAGIATAGLVRDLVQPYKKRSDQINRTTLRWLAGKTSPGDRWVVFPATEKVPHAPYLYHWGGSAARFRHYIDHLARVDVVWAPPPAELPPSTTGRTWLIVYEDNWRSFPQAALTSHLQTSYLRTLTERFGRPTGWFFDLGRPEAIEIYSFPPQQQLSPRPHVFTKPGKTNRLEGVSPRRSPQAVAVISTRTSRLPPSWYANHELSSYVIRKRSGPSTRTWQ